MTIVATHAPGTFCWADLGTSDAAAAKRFYAGLFGWTYQDMPMGDGASYTMFDLGGNRTGSPTSPSKARITRPSAPGPSVGRC
jgi:uncharacterized protein